jgi:hypothetical protein
VQLIAQLNQKEQSLLKAKAISPIIKYDMKIKASEPLGTRVPVHCFVQKSYTDNERRKKWHVSSAPSNISLGMTDRSCSQGFVCMEICK